jgi:general secretion pathway protein D
MVFLRPVVLRDGDTTTRFSADRYDQIRGRQQEAQPPQSIVMPNGGPVAPPMPAPTQPLPPLQP